MKTKVSRNNGVNHFSEVHALWKQAYRIENDEDFHLSGLMNTVSSVFHPGKFCFFVINFFDIRVQHVHENTEEVFGCKPENFNFEYIFNVMHPRDAGKIINKEKAVVEFFYNHIPPDKMQSYKVSYTFRIKKPTGGWKHILHQSMAIKVADTGHVHQVLVVHTDISFMNILWDDRISFIGLNGEPSFYSYSTQPEHFLKPDTGIQLSAHEIGILQLLIEGYSSKQVAQAFDISSHTVDTHRRHMLKKTGCKNTLELAVLYLKKGLLEI